MVLTDCVCGVGFIVFYKIVGQEVHIQKPTIIMNRAMGVVVS